MNRVREILETYRACDIRNAYRELTLNRFNSSERKITSPADTRAFLAAYLEGQRREEFVVIYLDTRHRIIEAVSEFQGSIDGACVYPRVIAEHALERGAAAIIIAHNHPSGEAEPSLADQAITRRIRDALQLLEIRLLDHLVIGRDEVVSLAERGML